MKNILTDNVLFIELLALVEKNQHILHFESVFLPVKSNNEILISHSSQTVKGKLSTMLNDKL